MVATLFLLVALQTDLAAGDVRRLAGDMKFTEGPIADGKGSVYFSDIPANRIMKWDGKENKVWREDSGGANGLRFDKDGQLYVCEGGAKRVTRISPDQKVAVLADKFNDKPFNSPNDLCFDARGGLYFTDPNYGGAKNKSQDLEGVYYLPPGGGKVVLVVGDLKRPNGIEMGKDRLYIADHGGGKVYSYAVNADGTLADRKDFAPVACDGMKLDEKGNLYTTTGKGVEIFGPDGKPLGVLQMPEVEINGKKVREGPANCAFSGNTLFITARTSLYAVDLKVKGQ
jgi:gluconolactonase